MIRKLSRVARAALALSCAVGGACHAPPATAGGGDASADFAFTTDSTRYSVRREGILYRANIGYPLANRSGGTISQNYCRTPTPPKVEKRVGDRWVAAYHAVVLLCLTLPPFRIRDGETYSSTVPFAAAPPGLNVGPELLVSPVPGIYRLRWGFSVGPDPAANGPTVEVISNEFQLVER
jgi:hypothetical protein